jgi:hypothetical protein
MALASHVDQGLAPAWFVNAVEIEHCRQVSGPGGSLARFDTGQRGGGQTELLGDLLQLERVRFPQAP